jgi:cytidine deaminase
MDAISKLPSNKKKVITINIIVVRINGSGLLRNSKPCGNCLKHMSKLRGYRLKNIYYSEDDGTISKKSFQEMVLSKHHFSKRFRQDVKEIKEIKEFKELKESD